MRQKGFAPLFIVIILAVVGIIGAYYIGTQNKNLFTNPSESPTSVVTSTPKQIVPTTKPTTDPTAKWKEYTDSSTFLRVKYPSMWRVVEGENWYGFGPKEVGEDILWAVNYYGKDSNSIESIKNNIGKQFSDRKQTSQEISINGIKAVEIITTTPSIPSWYSDTILLEYGTTYITLSNGAISDSALQKMNGVPEGTTFKGFYSSVKFMND